VNLCVFISVSPSDKIFENIVFGLCPIATKKPVAGISNVSPVVF
jgi:hypothetical protein